MSETEEFVPPDMGDEEDFEDLIPESLEDDDTGDASSGGGADLSEEDEEEEEEGDEPPAKKRKTSAKTETVTKKGTTIKKRKTPVKKTSSKSKSPKAKSSKKDSKSKSKKATGTRDVSVAKGYIKDFLLDSNRPWSVVNLVDQLKGKAGKAIITKALDALVKSSTITEKVNGKQKVYWINQENMEVLDEDDLQELEKSNKASEQGLLDLRDSVHQLEIKLKKTEKSFTNEELDEEIERLKKEIGSKKSKLDTMSSTTLMTPEEKKELTDKFDRYFKAWKQRRDWCMQVIDMWCSDSHSIDDLKKKGLELETDEECGANLRDMVKKAEKYH
mmetsp:Transcript_7076/g.26513  ORF Transcript_7076/g.26513 Transcript_7076/m.26513 type:complete len:330 (-) Transcript_7076:836-1825(-)|eukprot:CAMPEP_0117446442 /NCGR_PEP_ID=MMETSP0759-20121206/6343_1 /TAXON_ID=63605 /ORGANISM="Percolomonas cosmopolitus, Strain WS" /LENGTH=329 /DNA_ID=CAMNT_0005238709 /DNA_START=62 /DNA_END=1051 /DNA_ORIENTATION=-